MAAHNTGVVQRLLISMTSFLAPLRENRCASCSRPIPWKRHSDQLLPDLCDACLGSLTRRTAGFCPRCGNLMDSPDSVPAPCGVCCITPPPWERFFFHGAYKDLLRALLLRLKHRHDLSIAELLGRLAATHPEILAGYDAIIAMPLHPARLRERGFNQSVELARPLARQLRIPLRSDCLFRIRHTIPQAELSLADRRSNVRNAFSCSANLAGQHVLLFDDIATTCASLEHASLALCAAGAAAVDIAVIARTPMERSATTKQRHPPDPKSGV